MPYHYHSSLVQLNCTSSGLYEVSGLWLMSVLCVSLGRHCWSGPHSHMASPKPWALGPVAGACGAAVGTEGCGWCCCLYWYVEAMQTELLCINKSC